MQAFRLISLGERAQWDEALAAIPHAYWHTWIVNDALYRGTEHDSYLFVSGANGDDLVACTFAEREWAGTIDIYTPAGFTGFTGTVADERVRRTWLEFVASRGYVCGYFALHPMVALPPLHEGLAQTNSLYCLDLRGGAAAVLAKALRTVRRSMNEWREEGHSYVTDRVALQEFLVREYPLFMKTAGASPHATWSEATLRQMLADPALLIAGVADDEGICAAYSFAVAGTGSECHLNVSTRNGRQYTTALLAWGIDQLAAAGVQWLNLGGGVRAGDAIAQAKEKFRPEAKPLIVAREVYDAHAFNLLCGQAGCEPGGAGFFPPYRAAARVT